jgi:hypothetical protein
LEKNALHLSITVIASMHSLTLDSVPKKWRLALMRFLQTGEGSPEFLHRFDHDPMLQSAFEMMFEAETRPLRNAIAPVAQQLRARLSAAMEGERRSSK